MTTFLEKTFGSSWRTSLWGFFTGACLFLYANPDVLTPLPDYWESLSKQILTFLMAGGVIKMGTSSRDKVTSAKEAVEFKEQAVHIARQVAATVDKKVEKVNEKVEELKDVMPMVGIVSPSEMQKALTKIDKLEDIIEENSVITPETGTTLDSDLGSIKITKLE